MRLKIDNQNLQDKEVESWWNTDKTKKWHHFTYDNSNPLSAHLILRQQKVLNHLLNLKLSKGSKVLELGGGAGQTAKKICDLGFNYVGIDISKHLCKESENKCFDYVAKNKAKFINQSIEKDFPLNDNEFDVCIIVGSIQYVGNLEKCFNEINRVLKKNAYIIICQANMYALLDLIYPRKLLLRTIYFLLNEEFLISPCFKAMLCESKLGKYFKKYENSRLMNINFMTKGDDKWKYKIRKRMYSFKRIIKILNHFDFKLLKKDGATFFHPKKGFFYWIWKSLDYVLQKLADYKILPFLKMFSDNLIVVAKKNK